MIVSAREIMPIIRAALKRSQNVRMTVNGSSMLPFLCDGDVVEIEPMHSRPVPGDLVLVQCPEERYVLHRVVRLGSDGFFLRGDAQAHCMGPFKQSDILGRAAKSYHHGRIRAHDRGAWRIAGLIWIHCGPLGSRLPRCTYQIRGFVWRVLRRMLWISAFHP
jgi:hypothetical protein